MTGAHGRPSLSLALCGSPILHAGDDSNTVSGTKLLIEFPCPRERCGHSSDESDHARIRQRQVVGQITDAQHAQKLWRVGILVTGREAA